MGACTVPGKLMIVTELMRGDLESMVLGACRAFSPVCARVYALFSQMKV